MGEFTENLLKLTEFPFSYSLIGLIALIIGKGINPDDLTFDKIGPLLILMGFVATTMSICDPVGAIQRFLLVSRGVFLNVRITRRILNGTIWGYQIQNIFPAPYIFCIAYSPRDISENAKIIINWPIVEQVFLQRNIFSPRYTQRASEWKRYSLDSPEYKKFIEKSEEDGRLWMAYEQEVGKLGQGNLIDMSTWFHELLDQTVRTKWITAEIDKISALIYFVIIISFFIAAVLVVPDFLPKFAASFGTAQLPNPGAPTYLQPINLGILAFSIVALFAVIIMLRIRHERLQEKGLTVFKYLTALGAIKTSDQKFKPTLEDIERYLNDNHWTLADYWVNRIQMDYSEIFLKEVTDKKVPNKKKTKDTIATSNG